MITRGRGAVVVAGAAVIIAAGLWLFARPHPVVDTAAHQVFQPEAQMLASATHPAAALARPQRSTASTSRDTALPYAYDQALCATLPAHTTQLGCIDDYYKKLVDTYGVDVAFADLKKRYDHDPFVVAMCHPITHVIGREAATLYPTISEAYLHGDSFCWSGYYHGVLEGIIAKIGKDNLPGKMPTICADIPGKSSYSFQYYNCVHGLGHGVMELSNDDLIPSLKLCDLLAGDWERQSCYSGVFMENIIVFGRDGSSPGLHPDQPLYPCTAVDGQYKYQCYLGQTSFVLSQNKGNFTSTFGSCAGVEDPYRAVCDQSIGRDAADYANHDATTTESTCLLASDAADVGNCVTGAVKEFISFYHSLDQANAFCSLFTEPERSSCLATGKEYFSYF